MGIYDANYEFSKACRRRLEKKDKEGLTGWDDEYYKTEWQGRVRMLSTKRLTQKELVDIANYCMFLWHMLKARKK